MALTSNDRLKFREMLEQKVAKVAQVPRRRTDIAIERSPDQMDEVQYAAERELAIQNLDRESGLMRDLRGALRTVLLEPAPSVKRTSRQNGWQYCRGQRIASNAKKLRTAANPKKRNRRAYFSCTPLKRAPR